MSKLRYGFSAARTIPFRRVTITLCDEAENITILPPLDKNVMDKVMFFQEPDGKAVCE